MALTEKEKTAYLSARIEAIEEFLATVFPSFAGDFVESTARRVDAHADLSANGKKEAKEDAESKRQHLKKK